MKREIFFLGLIILIAGLLVGIYDFPQLIYLENKLDETQLGTQEFEKFERLQIEFFVGVGMVTLGTGLLILGVLPRKF